MKSIENVMPLSDAVNAIESALEASGGEITPQVAAMQAQLAKLERITDLSNWYLRAEADHAAAEAALKPMIKELQLDIKSAEQRIEYIKNILIQVLPPGPDSQVCSDKANVFYSESSELDVFDPEAVPFDLIKVVKVPDGKAIKAKLEAGEEVPGARLKINWNLQVKHAGPRASKNAAARAEKRAKKTVDLENAITEGK